MTRLEADLGALLAARGWTISGAESCTGGLVMHRLTNVPGSSAYVLGGVVAYDNSIKSGLLGVQEDLLAAHGAVSAPVARALAAGALGLFGTHVAYAVTGIAGPGGGSPDKPVGLTYVAAALRGGEGEVERHVWTFDREGNKAASADAVLRLLLRLCQAANAA